MEGYEEEAYAFTNANAYTDLIDQFLKERDSKLINDINNNNESVVVEDNSDEV